MTIIGAIMGDVKASINQTNNTVEKRLRFVADKAPYADNPNKTFLADGTRGLMKEAADKIEELEAETKAFRTAYEALVGQYQDLLKTSRAAPTDQGQPSNWAQALYRFLSKAKNHP